MVESIQEFKDELIALKKEMRAKGAKADTKLVASWIDKLTDALERLSDQLDLMAAELEELSR